MVQHYPKSGFRLGLAIPPKFNRQLENMNIKWSLKKRILKLFDFVLLSKIDLHLISNRAFIDYLMKNEFISNPRYAYGMYIAAVQSLNCGNKCVTAVEFGVASGGSLREMCRIAKYIHKYTGVKFNIYGFDSGVGLLKIDSYKDHPELWKVGEFPLYADPEKVKNEFRNKAILIYGDVKETIKDFVLNHLSESAPLGFFSIDLDTHTASKDALFGLLADSPEKYLPVVPAYFDDVGEALIYNAWCGEELSINEFNQQHDLRKIQKKLARPSSLKSGLWRDHYYFVNILDHEIRSGKCTKKFKPMTYLLDDF